MYALVARLYGNNNLPDSAGAPVAPRGRQPGAGVQVDPDPAGQDVSPCDSRNP